MKRIERIDILENNNKIEGIPCYIEVKEVKIILHTTNGNYLKLL